MAKWNVAILSDLVRSLGAGQRFIFEDVFINDIFPKTHSSRDTRIFDRFSRTLSEQLNPLTLSERSPVFFVAGVMGRGLASQYCRGRREDAPSLDRSR
jgi:hypothetical protein